MIVHEHQVGADSGSLSRLCQVFLTRTHLAIVMEYAKGDTMYEYVVRHKDPRGCLSEVKARWMFQQLMIAVDFCHRMVRSRTVSLCKRQSVRTCAGCCVKELGGRRPHLYVEAAATSPLLIVHHSTLTSSAHSRGMTLGRYQKQHCHVFVLGRTLPMLIRT